MDRSLKMSEKSLEKISSNSDFLDSKIFSRNSSSPCRLPTPNEVREAARAAKLKVTFGRPTPVIFPSLGVFVKYGGDIRIAEAQVLRYLGWHLSALVRIPEVYGCRRDDNQTFIYMEYIPGDTLEKLWPSINEESRGLVCSELRMMVKEWRTLEQEVAFIGVFQSIFLTPTTFSLF